MTLQKDGDKRTPSPVKATRIKICGITNRTDALAAVDCGTDALGFVFAESSRRIAPETARDIIHGLPPLVTTVGVFVDQAQEEVKEIALFCHLDALQLHGHESPAYCRGFYRKVIKAFGVQDASISRQLARYEVSAYLLDSSAGGGSGRRFDWTLARDLPGRIILAGGLDPANVAEAIRIVRPYGVDVSSGVERSPGKKDHRLMKEFVTHVRRCEREH
jgi:phosphoribosylanthranilate isomerase